MDSAAQLPAEKTSTGLEAKAKAKGRWKERGEVRKGRIEEAKERDEKSELESGIDSSRTSLVVSRLAE